LLVAEFEIDWFEANTAMVLRCCKGIVFSKCVSVFAPLLSPPPVIGLLAPSAAQDLAVFLFRNQVVLIDVSFSIAQGRIRKTQSSPVSTWTVPKWERRGRGAGFRLRVLKPMNVRQCCLQRALDEMRPIGSRRSIGFGEKHQLSGHLCWPLCVAENVRTNRRQR